MLIQRAVHRFIGISRGPPKTQISTLWNNTLEPGAQLDSGPLRVLMSIFIMGVELLFSYMRRRSQTERLASRYRVSL